MDPVKKILFPVDFSPSCLAMALYVRRAAQLLRAKVTLIHVIDPASLTTLEGLELYARPAVDVLADHRAVMGKKLDLFLDSEFSLAEVPRVLATGDPATVIAATAKEQEFGLVVMPTHAGHHFRQMLLGSTTAKVLNQSTCPVLTSAHSEAVAPKTTQHKKWLCAIDLSPYSETVLAAAKRLAEQAQGELSIVHVVQASGPVQVPESGKTVYSQKVGEASEELSELLSRAGLALPVRVSAGPVKQRLLEAAAAETADVLIMGRSGTANPLERLRDLTYAVVRDSPCPVLSV